MLFFAIFQEKTVIFKKCNIFCQTLVFLPTRHLFFFFELLELRFKGKHKYWSLSSMKLQIGGLQFYQKEILAQVFSCGFFTVFKNTYLTPANGSLRNHVRESKEMRGLHKLILTTNKMLCIVGKKLCRILSDFSFK